MVIVTAYATLGEEGLSHSLIETQPKEIFLDPPQLIPTFFKVFQNEISVKIVIYHGEPDLSNFKIRNNIIMLHYNDLLKLGQGTSFEPVPPKPAHLACIMYTSGSSGRPKGVLITHRNIIAAGIPSTSRG